MQQADQGPGLALEAAKLTHSVTNITRGSSSSRLTAMGCGVGPPSLLPAPPLACPHQLEGRGAGVLHLGREAPEREEGGCWKRGGRLLEAGREAPGTGEVRFRVEGWEAAGRGKGCFWKRGGMLLEEGKEASGRGEGDFWKRGGRLQEEGREVSGRWEGGFWKRLLKECLPAAQHCRRVREDGGNPWQEPLGTHTASLDFRIRLQIDPTE